MQDVVLLFGTQKSGTTWLRNIFELVTPLNPHAEWQLPYLADMAENYVLTFSVLDPQSKRKAQKDFVQAAFSALLQQTPGCFCDKSAYPSVPEAGCNDGVFAHAVTMGRYYFPNAKHVLIVRDPRDVLVSSKHYWPAFKEKTFAALPDYYLEGFIDSWSTCNLKWAAAKPEVILRYEDLKTNFVAEIRTLMSKIGFEVDAPLLREIEMRFSTIDESRKQDPSFYRKGIVGDWQNELSVHQNAIIWNAGMEALQQFGYTKSGLISDLRAPTADLVSLPVVSSSFDEVINYNADAGMVFTTDAGLRCFVFDDGFHIDVDVSAALTQSDKDRQIIVWLELLWDDFDRADGKWFGCTSAAVCQGEMQWKKAAERPGQYGQVTTVVFSVSTEQFLSSARGPLIRLKLFNGVQSPITAWIKSLRIAMGSQHSRIADQMSDLVAAAAPPADPVNAFFRSVGWTALHFAANCGQVEVVSRLLDLGISPDVTERNGATALHRAADFNHKEVAEILLVRGANSNAIDETMGETPLDVAVRKNHEEIAQLLQRHDGRAFDSLSRPREELEK